MNRQKRFIFREDICEKRVCVVNTNYADRVCFIGTVRRKKDFDVFLYPIAMVQKCENGALPKAKIRCPRA